MTLSHDDLATDLAAHLRGASKRVTWEDLQLGPSGSPRPDVYTMEPTFTRMTFEAFEVKVSVADFRADVTSGKWQSYLKFANAVTFAAPSGLVTKDMVPSTCGLILRGATGQWKYAKRPVHHVLRELPWQAWIKLLLDGIHRSEFSRRRNHFNEYLANQVLAKKFGAEVGHLLNDIQALPGVLEYRRAAHDEEMKRLEEHRAKQLEVVEAERAQARDRCAGEVARLAMALGLKPDAEIKDLQVVAKRLADLFEDRETWGRGETLKSLAVRMQRLAAELDATGSIFSGKPVATEIVE